MRDEAGSRNTELEGQRAEVLRRFGQAEPMPTLDDLLAMQREFPALAVEIAAMADAEAAVLLAIMRGEDDDFEPDPAWLAGVHREADELLASLRGAGDDSVDEDDGVDGAGAPGEPETPGIGCGPARWPRLVVMPGGRADAHPSTVRGHDAGR